MFWLGLILPIAFVPGYTGAYLPTGWAVLSLFLPALALWREAKFGFLHWALVFTLGYAAVSLAWTPNVYNGIGDLWHWALFALAFYLGSTIQSTRPLLIGLALGATICSIVCCFQWAGYHPVLGFRDSTSGLAYNTIIQAEITALIILMLVAEKLYWLIPALIPGLLLPQSRGAIAALAIGLLANWVRKPLLLIGLFLIAAVFITANPSGSDLERMQIWRGSFQFLSWFGNGIGSFLSLWMRFDGRMVQPEYSHNDFLQLAFELGLGAIPILGLFGVCFAQTSSREWPVYVGFIIMALVSFPLHTPVTGFIAALVAGRLAGDWGFAWDLRFARRSAVHAGLSRSQSVSIQS